MPSIFSADATLDEIFDTYFDDSKWDNYKEDGKKIVTYTGDRVVESGRTLRFRERGKPHLPAATGQRSQPDLHYPA